MSQQYTGHPCCKMEERDSCDYRGQNTTILSPSTEEKHLNFLHNIYPNIKTFTKGLTEDHWRSLTSGTPDNFTKLLLAKLILDILSCVSKKSAEIFLTEENVKDMLGNTLPQIFADVLHIEGEVHSDASVKLNKLLRKEVTDILNCDASGSMCSFIVLMSLGWIYNEERMKEYPLNELCPKCCTV